VGTKTKKTALTDDFVARLVAKPAKPGFKMDQGTGAVGGFGVRVQPGGKVVYVVKYTTETGPKMKTLDGDVTHYKTVEEARAKARDWLNRLNQDGIDPKHGDDDTMQQVMDFYVAGLKSGKARRKMKGVPASDKHVRCVLSAWNTHCKTKLGPKAPKEVTRATISKLHDEISDQWKVQSKGKGSNLRGGQYIANRVIAYLQAAWNLSANDGLTSTVPSPFGKTLTKNRELKRQEYLKVEQVPAFMRAVHAESPRLRGYWMLSILYGVRGCELRNLRWDDIDEVTKSFKLRKTKNGETRSLPLTADARKVFKDVPNTSVNVFPFGRPRKSWKRILKKTGFTNLRPHDVRRSFGTWLAKKGQSAAFIGSAMGHKSKITAEVYMAIAKDEQVQKEAFDAQAAALREYGGDNVIQFPTAKAKEQVAA
jgi:integrase